MNRQSAGKGLVSNEMARLKHTGRGVKEVGDPAYIIGRSMIETLMGETNVSFERAVEMLLSGEGMPTSVEAMSAIAADELIKLKEQGKLNGEIDDYLEDPEFQALISELPVSAALRVYEAQRGKREMEGSIMEQRTLGREEAMEKLRAQRALPMSSRAAAPAQPEVDFHNMSTEQFNQIKERLARESRRR